MVTYVCLNLNITERQLKYVNSITLYGCIKNMIKSGICDEIDHRP